VYSGHPGAPNNAAAAILAYDVPHRAPWDWRVSLYTWTKSVAAGAYLVPLLLVSAGVLPPSSVLWTWAAPIVAAVFLVATGALLVADLAHPERFYMVLTRPQWRSWLARGGVIISLYGLVLGAYVLAGVLGREPPRLLGWAGFPLAVFSAVYTAWLFAQAKARDLWQSPLLPPLLLVQALLAGSSVLVLVATVLERGAVPAFSWVATGATLVHVLLVAGEVTMTHSTAHARLAAWEMTRGRYAALFRGGFVLQALGVLVGIVAPGAAAFAAVLVLAGLLAYEHSFVQAGQSVPLA
jgi:formate-dependent nitrite reductase membrane component NrfD